MWVGEGAVRNAANPNFLTRSQCLSIPCAEAAKSEAEGAVHKAEGLMKRASHAVSGEQGLGCISRCKWDRVLWALRKGMVKARGVSSVSTAASSGMGPQMTAVFSHALQVCFHALLPAPRAVPIGLCG